jgi:hypothetical protein
MSYAAMAAKNAPPEEQLPQPSQDLLDGHFAGETEAVSVVDDSEKVAVVTPEWKDHPVTTTSIQDNTTSPSPSSIPHNPPPSHDEPRVSEVAPTPTPAQAYHEPPSSSSSASPSTNAPPSSSTNDLPPGSIKIGPTPDELKRAAQTGEAKAKSAGHDVKRAGEHVQARAEQVGEQVTHKAGEVRKEVREDAKEVEGKAEEGARKLGKKAKAEFNQAESALARYYSKSKDVILRPGVLGGLLGVANVGIISTLTYAASSAERSPGIGGSWRPAWRARWRCLALKASSPSDTSTPPKVAPRPNAPVKKAQRSGSTQRRPC